MADDPVKKLLIKLGISTSEWKQAVREIKGQLNDINAQAKRDAAAQQAAQKKQIDLTKQQITDQQRLTAESKAMAAFDQAKASWEKKNQEALKTRLQQKVLETAELKKQEQQQKMAVQLEQQKIKLQQQQLRLLQQQTREHERQSRGGGEGGGGIFGRFASMLGGVAGGGPLGLITGGVAGGELLAHGIEGIIEKLKELAPELLHASGNAAQLREQFEKLTKREGVNPEDFLNRLRVATRGLVEDNTQLIRVANQFMSGPLKLQPPAIENLLGLTIALARATARGPNSVEFAMNALSRAAITGRVQMIGMAVGIDKAQLQVRGLGRGISAVAKEQMQLAMLTDAMTRRFAEVGTPMTTLEDLFKQVHMVQGAFVEDMVYATTHSKAFAGMIQTVSSWLMKATPTVLDFAKSIGEKIGQAFVVVKPIIVAFWDVIKAMYLELGNIWTLLMKVSVIGIFAEALSKAGVKITPFRAALLVLGVTLETVAYGLKQVANGVQLVTDLMDAAASKSVGKAAKAFADYAKNSVKASKDLITGIKRQYNMATTPADSGEVEIPAAGKTQLPTENEASIAKEEARLRLQITTDRIKAENTLEEQRISYAREANKEMYDSGLEDLQAYLSKERALLDQEHQIKLKQISDEEKAKLQELAAEAKGFTYKDTSGKAVTIPGMAPGVRALKTQKIRADTELQIEQENLRSEKAGFGPDKEQLADATTAYRTYIDTINKMAKQGVQERLSVLQDEFKLGRVSAEEYMDQRKQYIDQEYQLVKAGLDARMEAAKKNAAETAKINADLIQAEIDREKALTKLALDEDKIRIEALETHYNQAKKYLEIEMSTARKDRSGNSRETEQIATAALLDITREHLQELQTEQDALNPSVHGFSNEWVKVSESIAQARQEEQKLNQQLAISRDTAAPLAGIFGSIANVAGSMGIGGANVAAYFGKLQGTFESLSRFNIANQTAIGQGERGGTFGGLGRSFVGLFRKGGTGAGVEARQTAQQMFEQGLQKGGTSATTFGSDVRTASTRIKELQGRLTELSNAAKGTTEALVDKAKNEGVSATVTGEGAEVPTIPSTQPDSISGTDEASGMLNQLSQTVHNLNKKFSDSADKLGKFGGKLADAAAGAAGFIQGVTGGKTGAQGAVSGAMAGVQFGAQAGPLGAVVGGIAGGVMGGIFGSKEKQLQQDLHKIQTQMQGILDSLNAGTITLSQAIADLRRERQAALQMLAQDPKGGKGGGKGGKKGYTPTQAQAAIAEIDSQIAKLVDQQKQVLDNLHQSLMQIAQPTQFQEYISSLDQIIQKYQQFASAAQGNAQEVGLANQFLTDSLQNYVTTLSQNLNQAQQQAINDAIQLIDLERQRQQLINSEAQQEYDILTQGVMVRQRTTAMTKGQQIGELRYQRDMQLQQMNEQIALTQHKVDAESKIFNLAKTRIGLETELLAAQEEQADYQVKQIQALAQVVAALQSGLSGGQLLQQISQLFSAGALPTGTGLLDVLINQLGLGGNLPPGVLTGPYGATNWLAQVPQPYQSAANYVANMDPNFVTMLQAGQKAQAAADAAKYASQGTVEGFDMAGLINWLGGSVGAAANIPTNPAQLFHSYQTGGKLSRTGLVHAEAGETILPQKATGLLEKIIGFVDNPLRMSPKYPTPKFPGGSTYSIDQTPLLSSLKIKTDQQLTNMTQKRASMEMTVINQRQALIDAEMQYLSVLHDTMGSISSMADGGTPAYSLEGMLQHVYERRGRYGSGNFRRQTL